MKYLTILLIASLSLASSCQKEDMPPTDGHKNIFRCKVNGVEWTPHCISDFFGCSAIDCQYYKEDRAFAINAFNEDQGKKIDQSFGISKYNCLVGDNVITSKSSIYSDLIKFPGCRYYYIDTNMINIISIINIDSLNFFIEGTFEFTAISKCQDTVRITDGYFDVEYRF
ncbi:MAG: hypothetical protein K9I85_13070 [Saprospiraceae bacterium]|nr:hypothetical protein [Saprospiraceae bacterium]